MKTIMRALLAMVAGLPLVACTPAAEPVPGAARRIVSLDYCADQYVLRFADREDILALSPDAAERYSYMRAAARGLATVRPRTADVLTLRPDLVVRSYGGGPGVTEFLRGAGVPVIQLGYPQTIGEVRDETLRVGSLLGAPGTARAVVEEMDRRLAALDRRAGRGRTVLYMTPGGVTAGPATLVHDMLLAAGLANFEDRPGWNPIPLERLAYARPEFVAAAFFDSEASGGDRWSAARHPVARSQLTQRPVVPIEGAWTSCGGWFVVEAVEALARAGTAR